MKHLSLLSIGTAMLCGLSALSASPARAHIDLMGDLKARGGDEKSIPCDGPKGSNVYTFEPGATVKIVVAESIPHDSYFRVAFDNDSSTAMDLKDPASIDPVNPDRVTSGGFGSARSGSPKCLSDMTDSCGKPDFCNMKGGDGPSVLYDNIEPHLGSAAKSSYTWTIKLPDVECAACTLQVIQVMEDIAFGAHGPYDGNADVYHRCIDIKLMKGAGTSGPGNAPGPVSVGSAMTMDCTGGSSNTGAAGAPAAGTSGSAGSGAAGTPAVAGSTATAGASAGGAAAGMSGTAGTTSSAAGKPASAAGTTGSAGSGTMTSGIASAGSTAASTPTTPPPAGSSSTSTPPATPAASTATTPPPAQSGGGGCSVAADRDDQSVVGTLALGLVALAWSRRRARKQALD